MNTFEDYNREIIEAAVKYWQNNDANESFRGMENDPVVNLLLTVLSYQGFQIEKNIEDYERNTVRNLRDRIIPHHLIKPVPSFSIVETQISDATEDACEQIIDENNLFEFEKLKKKYTFFPLLKTKIINAECEEISRNENSIIVRLSSKQNIQDLSGISFHFDCQGFAEVEKIMVQNNSLQLIKPNQYNELPFTKMFNNNHWFMKGNQTLFGTYDYWQEIFLTNSTNLYYIDNYNAEDLPFENEKEIELEIFFKENVENISEIKINCVPVIQVEKREICLSKTEPIKEMESENGEFLNLLAPENEDNFARYINSFLVRQFGTERYNPRMLLQQLQGIADRYISDYYAFQNIDGLKSGNKLNELKESVENLLNALEKNSEENNWSKETKKNNYYAVLRKNSGDNLYISYLTTSGETANGIKKGEVATKVNSPLNKQKTKLLYDTSGGKNSITNELQKEDIAKFYIQTKDRIVTLADIRAFCYKEIGSNKIEKINIEKHCNTLEINIKLNKSGKNESQNLESILQKKLELHTNNNMKFQVIIGGF